MKTGDTPKLAMSIKDKFLDTTSRKFYKPPTMAASTSKKISSAKTMMRRSLSKTRTRTSFLAHINQKKLD